MANFIWKNGKSTVNLISKPYEHEEDFELEVMAENLLGNEIFILKNQIRGGKKTGIPDILAIDSDKNVCIIEMKNVSVDDEIVTQVIRYARWAEKSPDAIKNLWNESDQPEEFEFDFDNYNVRIIIVAPKIKEEALEMFDGLSKYEVDFLEINRWQHKKNNFYLVEERELSKKNEKIRTVRGKVTYDKEWYLSQYHNKASVKDYFLTVGQLEKLSKSKKWPVLARHNKNYFVLKYGFNNIGGIKWTSSKTFVVSLHVTHDVAKSIAPKNAELYKTTKRRTMYRLDKTSIDKFAPLFEKSLELLKMKKG